MKSLDNIVILIQAKAIMREKIQAILVGADQLGNIPQMLETRGIKIGRHIDGRKSNHQRFPTGINNNQLIIIFTDFLGHNVMRQYRDVARKNQSLFIACRRSTGALVSALNRLGL